MHVDFVRVHPAVGVTGVYAVLGAGDGDIKILSLLAQLQGAGIQRCADQSVNLSPCVNIHPVGHIPGGAVHLVFGGENRLVGDNDFQIYLAVIQVIDCGIGDRDIEVPVIGTGGPDRLIGFGSHCHTDPPVNHIPRRKQAGGRADL